MPRLLGVLLLLTLGTGCGGASPEQLVERERCYARAETASQKRVDAECAGMTFSECPAADDIMDALQQAQAACP